MKFVFALMVGACAAAPLDLPAELLQDVNKQQRRAAGLKSSFVQSPMQIKVSQSPKISASSKLVNAIRDEVIADMHTEIDFFLRALAGNKNSSFLQKSRAEMVPTSGTQLKNSLYVTQPLRTPSAAAVSIVERENTKSASDRARMMALSSRTKYLAENFRRELVRLRV
jgi:hypothetical protein